MNKWSGSNPVIDQYVQNFVLIHIQEFIVLLKFECKFWVCLTQDQKCWVFRCWVFWFHCSFLVFNLLHSRFHNSELYSYIEIRPSTMMMNIFDKTWHLNVYNFVTLNSTLCLTTSILSFLLLVFRFVDNQMDDQSCIMVESIEVTTLKGPTLKRHVKRNCNSNTSLSFICTKQSGMSFLSFFYQIPFSVWLVLPSKLYNVLWWRKLHTSPAILPILKANFNQPIEQWNKKWWKFPFQYKKSEFQQPIKKKWESQISLLR